MANWLVTVNYDEFDLENAYEDLSEIYWSKHSQKEDTGFQIDDVVYIYVTQPISKVMYKFKVIGQSDNYYPIEQGKYWNKREGIDSYTGNFSVFEKICKVEKNTLSRAFFLQESFIKKSDTLQGRRTDRGKGENDPIKLLLDHISRQFNAELIETHYPDEAGTENQSFPEGAKQTVQVNRYERSPEARAQCLEKFGTRCKVCEMSFVETYGTFAKDFIHVHHITPLHQISESYEVNPETDLIPVCPNCHAMLHRQENDIPMTVERLKLLYEVSRSSKM